MTKKELQEKVCSLEERIEKLEKLTGGEMYLPSVWIEKNEPDKKFTTTTTYTGDDPKWFYSNE